MILFGSDSPPNCINYARVDHYKKIINGKKYDTRTAEQLMFEFDFDDGRFAILLYRKRTGEFFSYTIEYWHIFDNSYQVYKRYIKPLTEDEARKLAEKYADGDLYEDIFGEVEE